MALLYASLQILADEADFEEGCVLRYQHCVSCAVKALGLLAAVGLDAS